MKTRVKHNNYNSHDENDGTENNTQEAEHEIAQTMCKNEGNQMDYTSAPHSTPTRQAQQKIHHQLVAHPLG